MLPLNWEESAFNKLLCVDELVLKSVPIEAMRNKCGNCK